MVSPAEEAPVDISSFLRIPPAFPRTVKNINFAPNKDNRAPEMTIERKFTGDSLNGGTKNILAFIMRIPTNPEY